MTNQKLRIITEACPAYNNHVYYDDFRNLLNKKLSTWMRPAFNQQPEIIFHIQKQQLNNQE